MNPQAKCPYCLQWADMVNVRGYWVFAEHNVSIDLRCDGHGLIVKPGWRTNLDGDP